MKKIFNMTLFLLILNASFTQAMNPNVYHPNHPNRGYNPGFKSHDAGRIKCQKCGAIFQANWSHVCTIKAAK